MKCVRYMGEEEGATSQEVCALSQRAPPTHKRGTPLLERTFLLELTKRQLTHNSSLIAIKALLTPKEVE
jgi:hypothetical protein